MDEVAHELSVRLKIPEVEILLLDLHKRFENFPNAVQLEGEIKKLERRRWQAANPERTAIKKKPEGWASRQAPGTPAYAEALFELIKAGSTDGGAFKVARSRFAHLTDEQVWQCYEAWTHGVASPLLKDDGKTGIKASLEAAFKGGK